MGILTANDKKKASQHNLSDVVSKTTVFNTK